MSTDIHVIPVDGMNCEHCTAKVEKAVLSVTGTGDASASLETGEVRFTGDVDLGAVRQAISQAGYEPRDA